MTVTYTAEVATCRGFGCFLKLLLRWRGSIYKLVWVDLVTYLSAYYALNFLYRFYLDDEQKKIFVGLVLYASLYTKYIPISFVLGFYVTIIVKRWWEQYTTIPKPNSISMFVSSYIIGQDERGRLMRRTIVRYVCLCITMVLIRVAPRVKKRFPTLQRLVEAGLLTDSERTIIAKMDERFPRPSKHWMPIVWAASIVTRARKEGLIRDDFAVKTLIDQLNSLRDSASILLKYDTITIPLVYTQVVTLAVYSYCAANILASQWFESSDEGKDQALDVYFPFFSTLQFFFYMGWLKVAEVLINPFGEDDEDFEVNWMIDENLKGCYMIVDEMHHEHPELMKDQYWDEVFPNELPGAEEFHEQHPEASTSKLEIPEAEAHLTSKLPPKIIVDDMSDGNVENGQDQPGQSAENLVDTVTMAFERFFRTEDEQSMQYLKETTQVSTAPSRASLSEGAKVTITVPDGSLEEDNETPEDDEFEKLRLTREKERQERNKLLISNPTQDVATTLDMSAFLEQIIDKNMDKIEPDSD